ncbi:MAG: hypothetical protein WDZ30_09665 [Cellvibrionaceae bacterium]
MKNDILTIAIVVFVVGVLASSVGLSSVFEAEKQEAPTALHQGVTLR